MAGATQSSAARTASARALSIIGHPVVLVPVAGILAAMGEGASAQQLRALAWWLAAIGVIVMAYSWWQVNAGRWAHVDASARGERRSLNLFLVVVLAGAALAFWFAGRAQVAGALAVSVGLIVIALAAGHWIKLSLHTAFAAYASAILWPNWRGLMTLLLVTAAVAWSRLVLARHTPAEIAFGLLLGGIGGAAYQLWAM